MVKQEIFRQVDRVSGGDPALGALVGFGVLFVGALLAYLVGARLLAKIIRKIIERTPLRAEATIVERLVRHIGYVLPALIISGGIDYVPALPELVVRAVHLLVWVFVIVTLARALGDVLDLVNDTYEQSPDAAARPIKGYMQIGKLLIYGGALILIVATLSGQSPLLILSGLGAATAVLLLVFRDTILSLVASVNLRSNDMLRVGDWIAMPQMEADGDVIDIALHTVRVQNFDKSVTAIPTYKFMSDPFKNWRAMREFGARRMKRSIFVDTNTIGFLSTGQWRDLHRFAILRPYLANLQTELDSWNADHADDEAVNKRRPTNIGTFRAYIAAFLADHPQVSDNATMLVRQLDPTEKGVPIELYCFLDTIVWSEFEAIQSDIFDHLLAIMPEFGLLPFQQPSGNDIAPAEGGKGAGAAAPAQ